MTYMYLFFLIVLHLLTAADGDVGNLRGVIQGWIVDEGQCATAYWLPSSTDASNRANAFERTLLQCATPQQYATYSALVGMTRIDQDGDRLYSLQISSNNTATVVVAIYQFSTASLLNSIQLPPQYEPSALEYAMSGGQLYIFISKPAFVLLVMDPTRSSFQSALISTYPVDLNPLIGLGQSTVYIQEGVSALQLSPSGTSLVILVATADISFTMTTYHLVLVSVNSGTIQEVLLSDTTPLSLSIDVNIVVIRQDIFLVSYTGMWHLTNASFDSPRAQVARVQSVDAHLYRASVALGCGEIAMLMGTSSVVNTSNSALANPLVASMFLAQPTLLSAQRQSFWYFLFVDIEADQLTYKPVDEPPDYFQSIVVPPSINSVTPFYYNSTVGTVFTFTGVNLTKTIQLYCLANNTLFPVTVLDTTTINCTLPPLLPCDGYNQTLILQLLAWGSFNLFSTVVPYINATRYSSPSSVAASVAASARQSLQRMLFSYNTASSLAPSGYQSDFSAPISAQTNLDAHSMLTKSLSYVVQQSCSSSSLSDIAATLPNTYSGLGDVYPIFAAGTNEYSVMYGISGSVMAADSTSLPPVLQAYNGAPSIALDVLSSHAQSYLQASYPTQSPTSLPLISQGPVLPLISTSVMTQLSALSVNGALQLSLQSPIVQTAFTNNNIQNLINLDWTGAINDPANLISQLSPGPVSSVLGSILSGDDSDDFSLPSSFTDTVTSLTHNIGDLSSDTIASSTGLSSSFMDDISLESSSGVGGMIQTIGAGASYLASNVFHDPSAVPIINTVANVATTASGIAEIYCGNIPGGISDVVSGLGGLFGSHQSAHNGPSQTQLMSQQISQGFQAMSQDLTGISSEISTGINTLSTDVYQVSKQVSQGFTGLSNEVSQGFKGLSNQVGQGFTGLSNQLNQNSKLTVQGFNDLSSLTVSGFNSLSQLTVSGLNALETLTSSGINNLSVQDANEFNALSNQTYIGFTSLSNQLYAANQDTMLGITQLITDTQVINYQLTSITQLINQLMTVVESDNFEALQASRETIIGQVTGTYLVEIGLALSDIPSSSNPFAPRIVPLSSYDTYRTNMAYLCTWSSSMSGAAAVSMSGDPTQTANIGLQIRNQMYYDLNFALIPAILAQLGIPSSLSESSNLPNPNSWAYAVNGWLEAQQVALHTVGIDNPTCGSQQLWYTGSQLQTAIRLAVQQSTFLALYSTLQTIINAFVLDVQAVLQSQSSLTSAGVSIAITSATHASSFDDICSIISFINAIAVATGLGSNGFVSGYVQTGGYEPTSQSPDPAGLFMPGGYGLNNVRTRITPFAVVTTSAYLGETVQSYFNQSTGQPADVVQFLAYELNMTLSTLLNAMQVYYPPCTIPTDPSSTLSVVDTTMRRLAGHMAQNQISFPYAGHTVQFPTPTWNWSATYQSMSSVSSTVSQSISSTGGASHVTNASLSARMSLSWLLNLFYISFMLFIQI